MRAITGYEVKKKKESKLKKYLSMFFRHTCDFLKGYVMGLVPRTRIIYFTNPQCRRMISISREWMGETLKSVEHELNEINPEMVRWQKENIPRIQKIIQEYEDGCRKSTADKTEQNRI